MNDHELAAHLADCAGRILREVRASNVFDGKALRVNVHPNVDTTIFEPSRSSNTRPSASANSFSTDSFSRATSVAAIIRMWK